MNESRIIVNFINNIRKLGVVSAIKQATEEKTLPSDVILTAIILGDLADTAGELFNKLDQ